jgi:hypothetical protein
MVVAHLKKFEPAKDSFFLKENETRAFIKPEFKCNSLSDDDIGAILGAKLTVKEFTTLFEELQEGRRPDWMPIVLMPTEQPKDDVFGALHMDVDDLVSPKFATKDSGIFPLVPKLSFESDNGEESAFESPLSPEEVTKLLKEYHKRFANLKSKWTQTFLKVEASYALVVKDLSLLHKMSSMLKTTVGVSEFSPPQDNSLVSSMCLLTEDLKGVVIAQSEAQTMVANVMKSQQDSRQMMVEAIEENESHVQEATKTFQSLQDQFSTMSTTMKEYERHFEIIFPILRDCKRNAASQPSNSSGDMQALQAQLDMVLQKVTKLEQDSRANIGATNPTTIHGPPAMSSSGLKASILDLKHQVKVLQHRIVGGGVKIGNNVFQSFEDVQVWVKAELPTRRYGLFVDAVSILDFFSFLGHIDAESQVSTLHNANKAGFTSIYKSRVAASVQNIFPKVFGKGDLPQYLPAIRHPDKWDDGSDGLMYQITKGMTDVETQLSSTIDTVLDGYQEARNLASQCLFKAK